MIPININKLRNICNTAHDKKKCLCHEPNLTPFELWSQSLNTRPKNGQIKETG